MQEKAHHHKLHLHSADESKAGGPEVGEVPFDNDYVSEVIRYLEGKEQFANEERELEFALGLRVFGELMLRHRSLPFFEESSSAFKAFIKAFKSE